MIEFVDLMEGRSLGSIDNESDQDKFWFSDQWVMEPILLGIRYQCLVDDSGLLSFHGKRKNYKDKDRFLMLPNIVQELQNNRFPPQTLFEGYVTFNNDKTEAYRFLKLEHLDEQLVENAQFYITDVIYYNSKDVYNLPLFDRKTILSKHFKESEHVKIQKFFALNKKNTFEQFEKKDVKVFMFKDLSARYSFKQSVACRVYKIPQQYFMVAMGYVENKEKEELRNMVVALEGGQLQKGELVKIMNVPVHSNDSRISLYNIRDSIVGKVFEILATEKTEKDSKYQEARFIQMRDDKKLENCIF